MGHATASVNGTVVAETDTWENVEGNIYFPPNSIKDRSILSDSTLHTACPWKGDASYYNINVNGTVLKDAAWYYPHPNTDRAKKLENYVAFYKSKVDVKAT